MGVGYDVNEDHIGVRPALWIEIGDYSTGNATEEINSEGSSAAAYSEAERLLASGDYRAAFNAFMALGTYKDSSDRAIEISDQYRSELLKQAEVGDAVLFGAYEQDNDASDGKEAIEWLVLSKEEDRILVISKYALDCQKYNSASKDVTWETCSLRKWLLTSFFNEAFSAEEQAMIPTVTVSADKNPDYESKNQGNSTKDQVFLLSITEANRLFTNDAARQCKPTAYAQAQGCYANNGFCWWWLRTVSDSRYPAGIFFRGSVCTSGCWMCDDFVAVRPAIWIEIGE